MNSDLLIEGMQGLGDNLHQRVVVREFARTHETVWLRTPWPSLVHDIPNVRCLASGSKLRTQRANEARQASAYDPEWSPRDTRTMRVWYTHDLIRQHGTFLGAMRSFCNVNEADFRIPLRPEWLSGAERLVSDWRTKAGDRMLAIVRPLVERTEWSPCRQRNPDPEHYRAILSAHRDRLFVVSVAATESGAEWVTSEPCEPDVRLHAGELMIETMLAVVSLADVVYASPGFMPIMAQSVSTPGVCVAGGHETAGCFAGGASFAPFLPIETVSPCMCFDKSHDCNKRIDLPSATAALGGFLDSLANREQRQCV
jgi:hypothetical protein